MKNTQNPTTAKVTVDIKGHGFYSADAHWVDVVMAKYLPASPAQLRAIAEERGEVDYSTVTDVTSFLIILADWEQAGSDW